MVFYQASSPGNIFVEVKDGGYPVAVFRNHICCIGGNWIGEDAKSDLGPRDTLIREIGAELSFEKPVQDTLESHLLGDVATVVNYVAVPCAKEPTDSDRAQLQELKLLVSTAAVHVGDNICSIGKEVFDRADPGNTKGDHVGMNSFFAVPLSDRRWRTLVGLQDVFGNLSNESLTHVTSLGQIVAKQERFSWGYDQIVQNFFLTQGLQKAREMSLVPGVTVEFLGASPGTYEEYLQRYDIARHP